MGHRQILVRFQDRTLVLNHQHYDSAPKLKEVWILQQVSSLTAWPISRLRVRSNTIDSSFFTVSVLSCLRGGKGGFGTLLKGQGRASGAKPTTDFGAARDLQGRRLRSVNEAIEREQWETWRQRIANGTATEEDMAEALLMKNNSSSVGWYLQTPTWNEASSSGHKRQHRQQLRLFRSWKRQRQNERDKVAERNRLHEAAVDDYVSTATTAVSQVQASLQAALACQQQQQQDDDRLPPPIALVTCSGKVGLQQLAKVGWKIQGASNFATFAIRLRHGCEKNTCYYYEVDVPAEGSVVQIGWTVPKRIGFSSETGDGVGDVENSFAYDPYKHVLLLEGKVVEMEGKSIDPTKTRSIGCLWDGTKHLISWTVDGTVVATHTTAATTEGLIPAISLNAGDQVELRLTGDAMKHALPQVLCVGECLATEEGWEGDEEASEETPPSTDKTSSPPPKEISAEPLDLSQYTSTTQLEALGLERLKSALTAIGGIKCGGTLQERAERLLLIKGLERKDYPAKVLAKKKK